MSLPAIARIIELEDHVQRAAACGCSISRRACAPSCENRPGARVFAAGATGSVVTLRQGRRVRRATDIVVWRPRLALEDSEDESPASPEGALRAAGPRADARQPETQD